MPDQPPRPALAVIGGTGLYQLEGLVHLRTVEVETPFGPPSSPIVLGELEGRVVAFLARHGEGHRFLPHEVNYRANLYALKALGVERVVGVTACGSLREDVAPGDFVIPDQLLDFTKRRPTTFFGEGVAAHIAFADPYCPDLSRWAADALEAAGARVHRGGTYLIVDGPRFSTRAESRLFQRWGADIVGMTAVPEAPLAREAELCFVSMAHVTDYDCWREEEEPVTNEMVLRRLQANVAVARRALVHLVRALPAERTCPCGSALATALGTAPEAIPPETRERLRLLLGRYL
ncbi:MAG: S-methyl-5'-thioadenosine phosphorylase [Anaerolineae bacterium]